MSRRHVILLFQFICIVFLAAPSLTMGAVGLVTIVPDSCNGLGGCKSVCDLATLAQNILTDAIYIAVFLSAVLFAWAGFLYLTNVANSGQHSRAVEVFKNVAIGLVIILAAWLLVNTLMTTLTSVARWNNLC
jgi:hypothetical protein